MENKLSTSDKLQIINNLLENIIFTVTNKGAMFYNIVIEEELNVGTSKHIGKAFSTDGVNLFGFTYSQSEANGGAISRIFSGTYLKDKGISLYTIPLDKFFIDNNIMDADLDAICVPDYTKMHGRFWNCCARVDVVPEVEEITAEKHIQPFIDTFNIWKDLDDNFTDRFLSLTTKAYQQDMNVAFIHKLNTIAKDIPIPSCFSDDGNAPKTKI